MREIKFRAWHKTKKIMVFPHRIEFPIEEDSRYFWENDATWDYAARMELMQFTDLKDKNGKEIYEGDIVKCYNGIVNTYFNSVVEWEVTDIQDDINDFPLDVSGFIIGSLGEVEIVGNLYENPELANVR